MRYPAVVICYHARLVFELKEIRWQIMRPR
jgi:hypothetical protein